MRLGDPKVTKSLAVPMLIIKFSFEASIFFLHVIYIGIAVEHLQKLLVRLVHTLYAHELTHS